MIAPFFPGDVNIASHPSVVFADSYEDTMAAVVSRYDLGSQNTQNCSLVNDQPPGSVPNSLSLRMQNTGATATSLYKNLANISAAGWQELWVRCHLKYLGGGSWHHNGLWVGGQNPSSNFVPQTSDSVNPPPGDYTFYTGAEVGHPSALGFDCYTGWNLMHRLSGGQYFGNTFLAGQGKIILNSQQWYGVELRLKLNAPNSALNGELQIWVDDVERGNFGLNFPVGSWTENIWSTAVGTTPFEGFRWRTVDPLTLNWVWLDHYTDGPATMWVDHLVVATERIGAMAPVGGVPLGPTAGTAGLAGTQARRVMGTVVTPRPVVSV